GVAACRSVAVCACCCTASAPGIAAPAGAVLTSAPHDHFTAGPYCHVIAARTGRIGGAGGCPTVGAGVVSPAGVQIAAAISAPDDHFTASPHCCVLCSGRGRVGEAGGCPTICAGIVSPAGVDVAVTR